MPTTYYYTYQGKQYNIKALARMSGITRNTLQSRLSNGWSLELTLTTPANNNQPLTKIQAEAMRNVFPWDEYSVLL